MSMSFAVGKTPIRLELEKNENIPALSSYYTAEHGKIVQWSLDDQQVRTTLTWRRGEVNARRARLVLGWVIVFGRVYRLGV